MLNDSQSKLSFVITWQNVKGRGDSTIMKKKQRKNLKTCKRIAVACLTITLAAGNFTAQPVTTQAATNKVTAIQLNTTAKKLCIGEKFTLKVSKVTPSKASKTVTWKTSNKNIVTVSQKGVVTAKKTGTAKITAVSKSNAKVKAVCKITVEKKDIVHSGVYKNTKWTIDKNGLLVVTGKGEMYNDTDKPDDRNYWCITRPDWNGYADEIKSARIEVIGATNLSCLFDRCTNLKSVDLSKLDTSKAQNMERMFAGCESLETLEN